VGKTGCHVYHPPVITSFIGGISLPFPVLVFSEFFKVDLSKSSQFLQKSEGFKESDWAEYNFICHLLPGYIYIYTLHYAALYCLSISLSISQIRVFSSEILRDLRLFREPTCQFSTFTLKKLLTLPNSLAPCVQKFCCCIIPVKI